MQIKIDDVLHVYEEFYKTSPVSISVVYTDNIYDAYCKLSSDIENIENQKEWIKELTGTIVVPEDVGDNFFILINSSNPDCNSNSWIGTLCHELTHVYDHIEFSNDLGCAKYKNYSKHENFNMFRIWSEFHARARGHYCLRYFSSDGNVKNEYHMEENLKEELTSSIERLHKNFNRCPIDLYAQMYPVMQFFGKLYVWEKLFPLNYTREKVRDILGYQKLEELYYYFKEHDEYDKVRYSFNQIRTMILNL